MSKCEQTHGQTILEHGIEVNKEWKKLEPYGFLEPYWEHLQKDISKWNPDDILLYQIFHDCGKPKCFSQDHQGNHFVNHAKISYETWVEAYGDGIIATWILHDMDIHIISADELDAFLAIPGSEVLLLTGLTALRANVKLFGGTDSVSFKIKLKHWERRAKAYLKRRYNG